MTYYVGTDIGGTFTDFVLLDDTGKILTIKVPTTPDDRTRGVLDAFDVAADQLGITRETLISELSHFAHGTTAATNAFIERKGARTALLATTGFADTLRVQRCQASWTGLLDHEIAHYSTRKLPVPIVARADTYEIDERIDYQGKVIVPLDEAAAREIIAKMIADGVEAVAIALLWSFRNPAHEARLAAMIAEMAPQIFVTQSSTLVPILGEYERSSTTAINSYLGPVIHRYIGSLDASVRSMGFAGSTAIMESGGGVLPAGEAAFQASKLLTSGPAGGVLASQKLGEQLGIENLITADMGGTSFDVGLVVKGQPVLENLREVGRFHVALPAIKVTAIGAGGGSIARIHAGQLTVGPESAGAVPGPACYRRGGVEPTITDVDVVLGIVDPDFFLGGSMTLDVDLARKAVQDHVATPLGLGLEEAAAGIKEVANNQMADLLRSVTTRVGYDPRDFTLVAYGGAGPTHAHQYAEAAGISRIIIPRTASVHSAFGTISADPRRSFSQAFAQHAPARFRKASDHVSAEALGTLFSSLDARCVDALGTAVQIKRRVGMRFRQQVHQIEVDMPNRALTADDIDAAVDRFEALYESIYGRGTALRSSGVEFISVRVEGIRPLAIPAMKADITAQGEAAPVATRRVYFYREGFHDLPVYRWTDLPVGCQITGPAIVERPDTTIVIGLTQQAEIEPLGNMIIVRKNDAGDKQ